MRKPATALFLLAIGITALPTLAGAQFLPLTMADKFIRETTAKAIATPGHAAWCARQRPGYRKQWNNWRNDNGRVTYCSSPYFSLPWRPYKKK